MCKEAWLLMRGRDETYHRLVNTTPKPRATKNKSDESPGLSLPPPPPPSPPLSPPPGLSVGAGFDMAML